MSIFVVERLFNNLQTQLSQRQFMLLSSVLVGLTVGFMGIILKTFAHEISVFANLFANQSMTNNTRYIAVVLPITGILLTVLVTHFVLKGKLEKGLGHIHYAIAKKSGRLPTEQTYAQIITSALTVGLGGSAGLEAPIVLTGAALGSNYALRYHLSYKERSILLGCGVAAGIGAMFNAPIAGVLFAVEVLLIDLSIAAFTPLIIAAATGTLLSKIILKGDVMFTFSAQQPFDYANTPYYIILGFFAGAMSLYHAKIFLWVEGKMSVLVPNKILKILVGGILLGGLIWLFPSLFGEGYQGIKILSTENPTAILNGSVLSVLRNNALAFTAIIGLVTLLKPVAAALTLGSGGNGGNFAPSLFSGAYLGFWVAKMFELLGVKDLPQSNFTIVGMAGVLSGIYHAPLTAIFLIVEITGGYNLILPLMIVSSLGFIISKHFNEYAMDTRKLAKNGYLFTADKDLNILTTINLSALIETNFQTLQSDMPLGVIVQYIATSKRNIFPVLNSENHLLGIIILDDIRNIIFKTEMYDKLTATDLMTTPIATIFQHEPMKRVMEKFDSTQAWNLPVLNAENEYIGFVSKSSIFSNYRQQLQELPSNYS